ncbi:dehydroquinate synthase/iron-containing alcohol dehydrogenase family protein [Cellulosilyticum ruminicola]
MKPNVIYGLVILLPAFIEKIYPACSEVLEEFLSPIGECKNLEQIMKNVKGFIEHMGVHESLSDLGFQEKDIKYLMELTVDTSSLDLLLQLAPIYGTKELLKEVYSLSM